jgi:TonB family protein
MSKEFQKDKLLYQKTIEKSLVFSLAFLIALVHIFPKTVELKKKELPPLDIVITVEDVPVTRQMVRRGVRPPKRPVIPVASEDPDVPMDATIDETLLDWNAGDHMFGNAGLTAGKLDTIPPRPLVQVLPEYPKELQKKNVRGTVKVMLYIDEKGRVQEAVVADNTTNSRMCADAALEAAKKSTYRPASIGNEKVATWVACIYTFKPD